MGRIPLHPGVELRANLKSISHRCYLFEVAFVWELTRETIVLPLGCLQGGAARAGAGSALRCRPPQLGCRRDGPADGHATRWIAESRHHPGGNPGANLKSISHRCHPILVAFVWELTKETIDLPLGRLAPGRLAIDTSANTTSAAHPSSGDTSVILFRRSPTAYRR